MTSFDQRPKTVSRGSGFAEREIPRPRAGDFQAPGYKELPVAWEILRA